MTEIKGLITGIIASTTSDSWEDIKQGDFVVCNNDGGVFYVYREEERFDGNNVLHLGKVLTQVLANNHQLGRFNGTSTLQPQLTPSIVKYKRHCESLSSVIARQRLVIERLTELSLGVGIAELL